MLDFRRSEVFLEAAHAEKLIIRASAVYSRHGSGWLRVSNVAVRDNRNGSFCLTARIACDARLSIDKRCNHGVGSLGTAIFSQLNCSYDFVPTGQYEFSNWQDVHYVAGDAEAKDGLAASGLLQEG